MKYLKFILIISNLFILFNCKDNNKIALNSDFWLSKPKKYNSTDDERKLPKMNVSSYELDYSSAR